MKLKELRENAKKNQLEIANFLNITQGTYGKYERGDLKIDLTSLTKLADYYGVSLDYLCDHETKGVIDLSSFSELKKGCVYVLEKLSENNTAIVLGYMTHILQEQSK